MARANFVDVVLSKTGKPIAEATVSIKVVAGAAGSSSLFQAETGAGVYTSLKTNSHGIFNVWLEEGRYEATYGGETHIVDVINQASVAVGSIGNEAVTTEKIKNLAVTEAKLANEAVSTAKLTSAVQSEIKAGAAKEETLSTHSGTIKLDLSKANVFHAELTGNAEFEITNAPAHPVEVELIVKQDNSGAHTWVVKSITWINSTPVFATTAKIAYLVSMLVLNTGAEILGNGSTEVLGSEVVTTEKIAALAVTEAKLGAEAVAAAKLKSEAVTTTKLGAQAVTRTKIVSEVAKAIPLERGSKEVTGGVTEFVVKTSTTCVFTTNAILVTVDNATAVGVVISNRNANEKEFTVKFTGAVTGRINYAAYE